MLRLDGIGVQNTAAEDSLFIRGSCDGDTEDAVADGRPNTVHLTRVTSREQTGVIFTERRTKCQQRRKRDGHSWALDRFGNSKRGEHRFSTSGTTGANDGWQ